MSDYLRDRLIAAIGEHYIIESELGRGGMAAVFQALDVRLNRRVAIKLLPPDMAFNASVRSRFLREAQMAAQLTHPNVVPIYMVDESDGLVYYVMALVDGDSAATLLARHGSLPADQVRRIVGEVADALDYAHRQGVVHRDIKPDNILLDRVTGRPMVTDFGIARAAAEESRLTVTGIAVGTPAYMSPEQAMGERDVDGRSDIYSLGIVAYQMLAGETPFRATNTPSMLMKHVSEPPPPLHSKRSDLPPSLVSAVERALAKRPEDRWTSAAEFRDAILDRPMARGYAPPPIAAEVPRAAPVVWAPARSRQVIVDVYAADRNAERSIEEKIARFRKRFAGYLATSVMLFGINAVTGGFPWFIFPVLGMGVGIVSQLGGLWGDGVSLRQIFLGANRRAGSREPVESHYSAGNASTALVPPDVLAGPHGHAISRAIANRSSVGDMLRRMSAKEREILPADIEDTVTALLERVTSLGTTLHRLDTDANGGALGSLDSRIASVRADPQSAERERKLALLERQRSTLRDLLERRVTLLSQLESASLALENLKLDLVRFRSAGVSTALEDVTSATREARALSRDIGHLLDAADEVRKL